MRFPSLHALRASMGLGCLLALLATTGGCSSGVGPPPDGGSPDGLTYDLALDLPVGCPPDAANALGVGGHCTRKGNQCTGGLVCTCDTVDGLTLNGVPCICTIAGLNISTTNPSACDAVKPNCGAGATCCNYMNEAYFCSPNVCLPGGACIDFSAMSTAN